MIVIGFTFEVLQLINYIYKMWREEILKHASLLACLPGVQQLTVLEGDEGKEA